MPLITRRSSTRALPRVSVGRCGLIFENCAFVSQNWSRLIYASFSEAVNHATTFVPTLLWVQTLVLRNSGSHASGHQQGWTWVLPTCWVTNAFCASANARPHAEASLAKLK